MKQQISLSPRTVFKTAFNLTKKNFLAYLPILIISVLLIYLANDLLIGLLQARSPDASMLDLLTKSSAVIGLLLTPLEIGLMLMGLKAARGEDIKASDIMMVLPHSAKVIVLAMLTMALVQLGFMLLILPGLFLMVILSMAPMLMCERKLNMLAALKCSAQVLSKQWFILFVIYMMLFILIILSLLTQGIALIVTLPFYVNVKGVIYCQLFDTIEHKTQQHSPKSGEFEA